MAYTDLDSIHVPSAGQRPPASWGAAVNANFDEVFSLFLASAGQWTDYTPTLSQSVTITKSITYARYVKFGRFVKVQAYLVASGAGSTNNPIRVTLPFTAVQTNIPCGNFYWYDASGNVNFIVPAALGTTTQVVGMLNTTGLNLGHTLSGYANGVANGDAILIDVSYESTS